MKAWIFYGLSALSCIIAGCSAQSGEEKIPTVYEVNADVLTLEQKNEKKIKQEAKRQTAILYAQLYNTLNEAVTELGVASNAEANGVQYAELIDFNKDGTDELYILLKNDGQLQSAIQHRQTNGYIHEIWSKNGEEKTATLSYSSQLPIAQQDVTVSASFIRGEKATYLSELQQPNADTQAPSTETIVAIAEKGLEKTTFVKRNEDTLINNKETESAAFVEQRKAFTGTVQQIITTDAEGTYSLLKSGANEITPVLQNLQSNALPEYIR